MNNHVEPDPERPLTREETARVRMELAEWDAMRTAAGWAWKIFLFFAAAVTIAYNVVSISQTLRHIAWVKTKVAFAAVAIGLGVGALTLAYSATVAPKRLDASQVRSEVPLAYGSD
jgi:hypothetical protein